MGRVDYNLSEQLNPMRHLTSTLSEQLNLSQQLDPCVYHQLQPMGHIGVIAQQSRHIAINIAFLSLTT
eukprot:9864585-Lingulodinium_polyedra.AAC.1